MAFKLRRNFPFSSLSIFSNFFSLQLSSSLFLSCFSVAFFHLIFCFQFNCPTFDVTQSEWWDAQQNCKVDFLVSVSILLFLCRFSPHSRLRIEEDLLIIPAFVYWELKVQSQIIFGLLVPDHPKVLVHSIWFLWTETIIVNDQVIQVESTGKKEKKTKWKKERKKRYWPHVPTRTASVKIQRKSRSRTIATNFQSSFTCIKKQQSRRGEKKVLSRTGEKDEWEETQQEEKKKRERERGKKKQKKTKSHEMTHSG